MPHRHFQVLSLEDRARPLRSGEAPEQRRDQGPCVFGARRSARREEVRIASDPGSQRSLRVAVKDLVIQTFHFVGKTFRRESLPRGDRGGVAHLLTQGGIPEKP